MKCNERLKLMMFILTFILVGGFICIFIGVEKIPQTIQYDANNPMPSDPGEVASQLRDYKMRSFGFLLVIIGCSVMGSSIVLILGIFVCLNCCECVWYDIQDKRMLSARVHFSNDIIMIPTEIIYREPEAVNDISLNIQSPTLPDLNSSTGFIKKTYDEATKKKIRQWLGDTVLL